MLKQYTSIELFAGAGGLALGIEEAGIKAVVLNELDKFACETLRKNRNWKVIEGDIKNIDFQEYKDVDVVVGGFPCQAFSYAGNELGFDDTRGTMFYEFARVVMETNPLICIGENVKGLLTHDKGRTLETMKKVIDELGYRVMPIKVLKSIHYKVPQKRERIIIVGIRKDVEFDFEYPKEYEKIYNISDALISGELYTNDVPKSIGSVYPEEKKKILDLVPPKGCWRDLPHDIKVSYMGEALKAEGGKTGFARRIGWDEPCLTLTCNPAQKKTERCHPDETRPFTVREYARIQTFPDDWEFCGSMIQQYKQIGNAVPVNLAKEIGNSIVNFLDKHYKNFNGKEKSRNEINSTKSC